MLHIINQSPLANCMLASCLRVITTNSAILLIEDGVYAATKAGGNNNSLFQHTSNVKIFALKEDLQARGLTEFLLPNIELVNYSGFVQLTSHYQKIHSWL